MTVALVKMTRRATHLRVQQARLRAQRARPAVAIRLVADRRTRLVPELFALAAALGATLMAWGMLYARWLTATH